MDKKVSILLDKVNMKQEYYPYFEDITLEKIKVNTKKNEWKVYLQGKELLPVFVYQELEDQKHLLDENASITFFFESKEKNLETYLSYYPYLLQKLKKELTVIEIYKDSLQIQEDSLTFVVTNEVEKEKITSCMEKIAFFYQTLGYQKEIPITLHHEDHILEEIKKDLIVEVPMRNIEKAKESKVEKKKTYFKKEVKDENSILGRNITEEAIRISTLLGEDDNVVVEGYVFGINYFESEAKNTRILTLKLTDYSDSIYCKVFCKEKDKYIALCGQLKEGNWYKIRGYTKNDAYSKELVLNARDIIKIEKKDNSVKDLAPEKRVELHCHTKMSQMDGLTDEEEVIKQAIAWGHKAIAITDHNGVQAFPHVYNFVRGYNKKRKEGEEPFKVIYGAELTLIDDAVNKK